MDRSDNGWLFYVVHGFRQSTTVHVRNFRSQVQADLCECLPLALTDRASVCEAEWKLRTHERDTIPANGCLGDREDYFSF